MTHKSSITIHFDEEDCGYSGERKKGFYRARLIELLKEVMEKEPKLFASKSQYQDVLHPITLSMKKWVYEEKWNPKTFEMERQSEKKVHRTIRYYPHSFDDAIRDSFDRKNLYGKEGGFEKHWFNEHKKDWEGRFAGRIIPPKKQD